MNDDDAEAPCPFCGHDCWGEGGFDDVCEHFVAEWAAQLPGEPSVLEQPGRMHAFDNATDLAAACRELQAIVGEDEDDPEWEARFHLFENALPTDRRPPWWSDLCDAVRARVEMDQGLASRDSAWHATWIMAALVNDVPGLDAGQYLLGTGGDGEGSVCFAWSEDPAAASKEISNRIIAATAVVHDVVGDLADALRKGR